MSGSIQRINLSGGGVPKTAVDSCRVTTTGLAGDRHAKPKIHGGPERAVSLFPLEAIERLAAAGHPIQPGSVGENVTTRDVDWSKVVPGARLRLGPEALLEIASFAAPCATIRASFADGDVSRLSQRVEPGQSRVYARVIREGVITQGDPIAIERAAPEPVDALDSSSPTPRSASMHGIRLGYVNLHVTDLERSLAFFEKTLGLPVQFSDPEFGYASVDAGPVRMGLARVDPDDEKSRGLFGRHTGLGFVVDDLESVHADLASNGVSFPMPPTRQPWGGFMALFEDPDGNVFYLDQVPSEGG